MCIVVLVLVFYLCPSSERVVDTFSGTVLFPLLCSVLPFFPQYVDSFLYLAIRRHFGKPFLDFSKSAILNIMKIRLVLVELFHEDGRTDGWTDITKLTLVFRNLRRMT